MERISVGEKKRKIIPNGVSVLKEGKIFYCEIEEEEDLHKIYKNTYT